MPALAQWLSQSSISLALRDADWLIPILQTIHILAVAMVIPSLLMIDLRVLQVTGSQMQSIADATRRFAAWIWTGLALLAASGLPLIVAEPRRTLPNATFQIKIVLIILAAAATCILLVALRRNTDFSRISGEATRATKVLAIGAFILWCAVAIAGRFIAYTQPS
jgi:Family of unknown function (DUF6644)